MRKMQEKIVAKAIQQNMPENFVTYLKRGDLVVEVIKAVYNYFRAQHNYGLTDGITEEADRYISVIRENMLPNGFLRIVLPDRKKDDLIGNKIKMRFVRIYHFFCTHGKYQKFPLVYTQLYSDMIYDGLPVWNILFLLKNLNSFACVHLDAHNSNLEKDFIENKQNSLVYRYIQKMNPYSVSFTDQYALEHLFANNKLFNAFYNNGTCTLSDTTIQNLSKINKYKFDEDKTMEILSDEHNLLSEIKKIVRKNNMYSTSSGTIITDMTEINSIKKRYIYFKSAYMYILEEPEKFDALKNISENNKYNMLFQYEGMTVKADALKVCVTMSNSLCLNVNLYKYKKLSVTSDVKGNKIVFTGNFTKTGYFITPDGKIFSAPNGRAKGYYPTPLWDFYAMMYREDIIGEIFRAVYKYKHTPFLNDLLEDTGALVDLPIDDTDTLKQTFSNSLARGSFNEMAEYKSREEYFLSKYKKAAKTDMNYNIRNIHLSYNILKCLPYVDEKGTKILTSITDAKILRGEFYAYPNPVAAFLTYIIINRLDKPINERAVYKYIQYSLKAFKLKYIKYIDININTTEEFKKKSTEIYKYP